MMSVSQTVSVSISMTVSMAIVSTMGVSQAMVSQMMSVSQTVSVSESVSVSVVSIGLRVSLSAPLSDVVSMKTLGRPGYERSGVSSMVSNAVSVSVEGSNIGRISLGTPLTNVVSTASVAGGLDSITKGSRPGRRDTTRAYKGIAMDKGGVSLRGGQGGNSQAGGNQELVHDDTTHWST